MRKLYLVVAVAVLAGCGAKTATIEGLTFDPSICTEKTLTMPDGESVVYDAYEDIYFVTNVEDSTYQTLNFYVPKGAGQDTPIFLRTYVGGFMAAKACGPNPHDATGRALKEGYVLCIPGARGWNSKVGETFTGRATASILDLKAAVRYLRQNDKAMPGDAEKIITDGTSAGGAMSSLLGSSGNSEIFEPLLEAMGAAKERDDVYAAVCYCPIVDLEHADVMYEWLYACTNTGVRALNEEQIRVSEELKNMYADYQSTLGLKLPDGTPLTADNYTDYLKSFLIESAQRALDEGYPMPRNIGVITYGLYNAQERGTLFIGAGERVYSGMVVGQNAKAEDIELNVCKKKQLTNTRSSSADEALRLTPPKILSLEQALEFIDVDELLEITPKNLRIRKRILDPTLRKRANFNRN